MMFARSIFLRGREQPIVLQYRTMESLRMGCSGDDSERLWRDDFGREFYCRAEDVIGDLVTDIARELEANSEIALIQARANARLQTQAQHDPVLKFARGAAPGMVG